MDRNSFLGAQGFHLSQFLGLHFKLLFIYTFCGSVFDMGLENLAVG